jgi:hypothetical protein
MPPIPIRIDGAGVDLSGRLFVSTTVANSPAAASETVVATVTVSPNISVTKVQLTATLAWTVGTSGTGVTLKLRQTDASGTTLYSTGITAATAAALDSKTVTAVDAAPGSGQVYAVTMTVANGAAASTVSAVTLQALAL